MYIAPASVSRERIRSMWRASVARADARDESAALLQVVGRLAAVEDERRVEEAKKTIAAA